MGVEEVDFLTHLRIYPFQLLAEGRCEGQEFRTVRKACFSLHYLVNPDFVCTWCVN